MKRAILETRRQVMAAAVCAYPGGRACAAARLGLPVKKLDNHVYENAGSQPLTDEQIHTLELEAGTAHLPEYICALYGGVFVPMPTASELDNVELFRRALETGKAEGRVNQIILEALKDGSLSAQELSAVLDAHRAHIAARHAEVAAFISLHRSDQP